MKTFHKLLTSAVMALTFMLFIASCGGDTEMDHRASNPPPSEDDSLVKLTAELEASYADSLSKLRDELTICRKEAVKLAVQQIRTEEADRINASLKAGLNELDLSMLITFPDTGGWNMISPSGLKEAVEDMFSSHHYQSPISMPRLCIGTIVPSFVHGGYTAEEGYFLSLRRDVRNPKRIKAFWDKNKKVSLYTLRTLGQLGTVAAIANRLLPYYEGTVDPSIDKLCRAYYDKHKGSRYWASDSPEYRAINDAYRDEGHAILQDWLFVQRMRDVGGDELIRTHTSILKELANV